MVGYLSQIIGIPENPKGFDEWLQWHAADHQAIHDAIQAQYGVNSPVYVLNPLDPADITTWLDNHESMHNDFNAVLGTQSSDLSSVDFKNDQERVEWLFLNFMEHKQAHLQLGI